MAELDDKELQRYENLLLKVQQYQIPEREVTFFDSAFRKHHENPTTELLAFFLNMNAPHSLHDTFYKGFIKSIQDSNTEYRNFEFGHMQDLGYEEITENFKRIDLWVETEKALIIVEVKIGHIQNNPVDDYKEWAEQQIEHK
ncbi:PD-(D/E)XK nuclease family protein, partial [Acinetobacter johnsonii]|uniref:PD-(D/E)XK nuclease family protein n=1 Tax=Acinetobacter johnsonii TaxID=40214 RepID=UPI0024475ACE